MTDVLELRAPAESEPVLSARVARDSRGNFFVAPLVDPGRIAVFDEEGNHTETVGRRGGGPGEFVDIRDIAVGPGDSLHVLHDGRITILSPAFAYARSLASEPARLSGSIAVARDGTPVTARETSAYGEGRREFVWLHTHEGPVPTGLAMSGELLSAADVAVAGDTIWVLLSDYSVHFRPPAGEWQPLASAPEWYAAAQAAAAEDGRRAPYARAIMPSGNHVLVLGYEFGPRPAPRQPATRLVPARTLSGSEFRVHARPRIDLWDRSGTLLTAQQFAGSLSFIDAELVAEVVEDSSFNHAVVVRRYRTGTR